MITTAYTTRFEHNGKSYDVVVNPTEVNAPFGVYVQIWPILKSGKRRHFPLVSFQHTYPVWTAFKAAGLVK